VKLIWDKKKSAKLLKERGVSFEVADAAIADGRDVLDVVESDLPCYRGQLLVYLLLIPIGKKKHYPHVVPLEPKGDDVWEMKTIFPSRKVKKLYGV
jgi:hypothetical protein